MTCQNCGSNQVSRDEVDIGVGVQYGPWQCHDCGWYEGYIAEPPRDDEPCVELDNGGTDK